MRITFASNTISPKILIHTTRTVATVVLYAAAALIPIFFLPITTDFFEFNKRVLLAVAALLLLLFWGTYTFLKKSVRVTVSPLVVPMLAFAGAILLSTFIATPYPLEVFWGRGLLILSLTLLFIFGTTLGKIHREEVFLHLLSASGVLVSIVSLAQATGYGPSRLLNLIPGITTPNTVIFNLAGSPLVAVLILLPIAIVQWLRATAAMQAQAKPAVFVTHTVAAILITAGIAINTFFMLPGKLAEPVLLPLQTSWSIMVDVLKTPKSALFGYGPDSYTEAFTQFRPANLNLAAKLWTVRFGFARAEPLQIATTLGLVGLAAWVFLLSRIVRFALPMRSGTRGLSLLLLLFAAELVILPGSLLIYALLHLTAAALTLVRKAEKDPRIADLLLHMFAVKLVAPETVERVNTEKTSQIFAVIVAGLVFVLAGAAGYGLFRVYAAEMFMQKSYVAAQKNDGVNTYEFQRRALEANPFSDTYHRTFATTNLLIANALAGKSAPTDQDKANIPQLLQQAIREAKTSTSFEPRRTANWEALAQIYKQLILVAQGSDQWAVAAFIRAIQTNPTDPAERFELGSVYIGIQNYEQAVRLFQQATDLKMDWANAHYNLSNAYKQKGDLTLALDELRYIRTLLPAGSSDLAKLDQDIAALEQEIAKGKRPAGSNTNTQSPTANKTTVPEGQIKLPQDLGLPQETPP